MALWKEHDHWKYETFGLDVKPEEFPGFEDVFALWHKKRGQKAMPKWADFDFLDFRGWHGHIAVTENRYDPYDYKYRLFGSKIVEIFEVDYTNKWRSSFAGDDEEMAQDWDLEFYEMTSCNKFISRVSGSLYWLNRQHVALTFLEFPLSDTGDKVTHNISFMAKPQKQLLTATG